MYWERVLHRNAHSSSDKTLPTGPHFCEETIQFSTLNYLFKLPPLTSCLGECQDINTSKHKTTCEEDRGVGHAGLRQQLLPSLSAAAMSHSPHHVLWPAERSRGQHGQENCWMMGGISWVKDMLIYASSPIRYGTGTEQPSALLTAQDWSHDGAASEPSEAGVRHGEPSPRSKNSLFLAKLVDASSTHPALLQLQGAKVMLPTGFTANELNAPRGANSRRR